MRSSTLACLALLAALAFADPVAMDVACQPGYQIPTPGMQQYFEPYTLALAASSGYTTRSTVAQVSYDFRLNLCEPIAMCGATAQSGACRTRADDATASTSLGIYGGTVNTLSGVNAPLGLEFSFPTGDVCDAALGTRFSTLVTALCSWNDMTARLVLDSVRNCVYKFTLYSSLVCPTDLVMPTSEDYSTCPARISTPFGFHYDLAALQLTSASGYSTTYNGVTYHANVCGHVDCNQVLCGNDAACANFTEHLVSPGSAMACKTFFVPGSSLATYADLSQGAFTYGTYSRPAASGFYLESLYGDACISDPNLRNSIRLYGVCDPDQTVPQLELRRVRTDCVTEFNLKAAGACPKDNSPLSEVTCRASVVGVPSFDRGYIMRKLGTDMPDGLKVSFRDGDMLVTATFSACMQVQCPNAVNAGSNSASDPATACFEFAPVNNPGQVTRQIGGLASTTTFKLRDASGNAGYVMRMSAPSGAADVSSVSIFVSCSLGQKTAISFAGVSAANGYEFTVTGEQGACLENLPKTYAAKNKLPAEAIGLIAFFVPFVILLCACAILSTWMHMYKKQHPSSRVPDPAVWLAKSPCGRCLNADKLYDPMLASEHAKAKQRQIATTGTELPSDNDVDLERLPAVERRSDELED